jgi:hypothetical protein
LGEPIKEVYNQKKKKDVSTNYYFMLVLINERAHSQFYFFAYLRRRHLIDPSPIFLEHGALTKIEPSVCFLLQNIVLSEWIWQQTAE